MPVSPEAQRRFDLISKLQKERGSGLLCYILSDRRGAAAQIAEDSVRPIFDHLRALGKRNKIDLFLYSVGGLTDIPWRIVTMIREFTEEFNILLPYKGMSAATMIALGADEIVMGPKGELGPIDPQLSIERGEGGTRVQEQISVETIMSYLRFLRERAGLTDQGALSGPLQALADKLTPQTLGEINRAHSHIRSVARKLLTARSKHSPPDEQRIQVIVDTLAEKTYQHGHAIGRQEAEEIGLKIVRPSAGAEDLMWELYEAYEDLCKMREPVDPRTFIPQGQDEHVEPVVMGCIESVGSAHHFAAELKAKYKRQIPAQLTLNLNLNLQLPPGVQPQQVPAQLQQVFQQLVQQLQQQAQTLVTEQVRNQMPIIGFEGWTQGGAWRKIEDWPINTKEKESAEA